MCISFEIVKKHMLSIHSENNVVYTIGEEKLTDEDYDRLIPLLQEKIRAFGKIRWYFEMHAFEGWSLSAMWRDIKFDFSNTENLERIAMVGDKQWEKELTQLMKPFTGADIKYFSIEESEAAKRWLKEIKS